MERIVLWFVAVLASLLVLALALEIIDALRDERRWRAAMPKSTKLVIALVLGTTCLVFILAAFALAK